MKPKFVFLFLLLHSFLSFGQHQPINSQLKEDFHYFWKTIDEEYCYFDKKQTDWQKVRELYTPIIDTLVNRSEFVNLIEKAFYEIYDHHAILNTNTGSSQRLVPSGTDIWAEYIAGKPVITEVRRNFGAEISGILAGMEVIAVNDMAVSSALESFLPKSFGSASNEAKSFALRLLLAGNHIDTRKMTLKYKGMIKDYFPDQTGLLLENIKYASSIESKRIDNTGYIKINDCLYDNQLIPVFDSIMQNFSDVKSIILDLRETPSGGNTTVAKAIIGWFINKEHFYQKHEYFAEAKTSGVKRSWVEIVSPREGKYFGKPMVILCNHWTGSIAEGIVIAFDALERPETKIIGTGLARLNGAVYTFEMPNTKIRFTFPVERLYHIDGSPREEYTPQVFIDLKKEANKPGSDPSLLKAIYFLKDK
jgi:carboxyl-terminal processing protease